jgi:hypothetical protein
MSGFRDYLAPHVAFMTDAPLLVGIRKRLVNFFRYNGSEQKSLHRGGADFRAVAAGLERSPRRDDR